MIQSFETQLQVVLRALNEVVNPALAEADKHVVEQLQLSIATLSFIKTRLPEARRFYRMDLLSHITLAEDAVAAAGADVAHQCGAIEESIVAGRAELARPEADIEDYQGITRRLREQITDLATGTDDAQCRDHLDAMVLDRSDAMLLQNRLWVAPFGFEPDIGALPEPAW